MTSVHVKSKLDLSKIFASDKDRTKRKHIPRIHNVNLFNFSYFNYNITSNKTGIILD